MLAQVKSRDVVEGGGGWDRGPNPLVTVQVEKTTQLGQLKGGRSCRGASPHFPCCCLPLSLPNLWWSCHVSPASFSHHWSPKLPLAPAPPCPSPPFQDCPAHWSCPHWSPRGCLPPMARWEPVTLSSLYSSILSI